MCKKILSLMVYSICALGAEQEHLGDAGWISATDEKNVARKGTWRVDRFRYAAASHLHTGEDGAALGEVETKAHHRGWPRPSPFG